ncbi:MAG: polysaccharide deacetylase family protein [Oscillospiraceae bacterium]|nr:polysaccharide deacetylase family protein [Oscillospiraceae bacterium]
MKTVPLRLRRILSGAALVVCAALVLWAVHQPSIVGASVSSRQLPIYRVQSAEKRVALSFDAAWGNEDTQTLIDILSSHDVRATFFLVGQWVEKYPESVQALAAAGEEVMNHSETHPHLNSLTTDEVQQEVNACSDRIEALTGARPTLFRCPYGEYDDHVIEAIRAIGVTPIQWDVDSLDWKGISAEEISSRVLSKVQPGSIVLFHNAAEHTPEALAGIIESLQADGYTIVPISELILTGDYTIDSTGCQIPS